MFEITTDKTKRTKTVKIDGYTFKVYKAGAGDSLTMQQAGREITKLGKKSKLTQAEEDRLESLTTKTLRICLDLFDSLGDNKAKLHLDSLDAETLLEVINQIFSQDNDASAKAS